MKKIFLILTIVGFFSVFGSKAVANEANCDDFIVDEMIVGDEYNPWNAGVTNVYSNNMPYSFVLYNWLDISDLYGYNCWELRVMRNTIYANYGYIFKSDDLRRYFYQFSWYNPRYKSEAKVSGMFTKTQKHNVAVIKQRERQLGC